MPKVDETKTQPFPDSSTGKAYINTNIKKYSDALNKFAFQNNITFIDVYDLLTINDFADGLHPNVNGHKKMFKRIKNNLFDRKVLF